MSAKAVSWRLRHGCRDRDVFYVFALDPQQEGIAEPTFAGRPWLVDVRGVSHACLILCR